ncbi:MAG: HD domain-containing protein [Candidatus Shikimatogenerans sp. JK-2022]|nr:HD domain-containing protein [Candidatus Shikimatogenerans bostrichidophilus]
MYLKKKILKNIKIKKILNIISYLSDKFNYKTYLIGGFVRNLFIKKKYKTNNIDIDIVTTGNSIILAKKFSLSLNIKSFFIFKRFKTAIVKYKNINIEFVSTRKEYYNIYNNKPYIKKLKNIKEDQIRRDFTINTIAIYLNKKKFGKVIDTFNGIKDIKNKILRTPNNPDNTFYDDPLRMIRAIRFSTQLNFNISNSSIKSIINNVDRIRIISIERIIQEFNKIILSKYPSIGLKLMYKLGFLSIILPEFINLKKKSKIKGYTYKDNYKHTLEVLDNISKYTNNLWLRWATLLHDIGKPVSKRFNKQKGWTFYYHEIIGSNMIPYIFHKLKLPIKKNMKYVKNIIKYSNLPKILNNKEVRITTIKKFINKIGLNLIKDIILLSKCDITTKNNIKKQQKIKKINKLYILIKKIEKENKIYNIKLPINGNDIINYFKIKPGKIIGYIKNKIISYIIKGKIENNYKEVFKLMKSIGEKIIK